MTVFEFLIPLKGGAGDKAMLATGQALATGFPGARITCVLAQPPAADALIWSADGAFSALSSEVITALETGAAQAWQQCQDGVADHAPVRAERLDGHPDRIIPERAALADVVVMDCPSARGSGPLAGVFETVLMAGVVPVLVVRRPVETLADRAIVAWDASPPAARALKSAMPFLSRMKEVLVVQSPDGVTGHRQSFSAPETVVERLAAAGVSARAVRFDGGRSVAEDLKALATDFGADLIVSGAYGHSRFGELVLGGTTRDLLRDAATPSLLLHH